MEGNKKDLFEIFIKEELEREAEEIRRENAAERGVLPETKRAEIRKGLDERIELYELEKRYPNLSAEEIRALQIGQEILEKEKTGKTEDPESIVETEERHTEKRKRKRGFRFYAGLAATFALVVTVGVTSLGGPERVVEFMESVVGEREIQQVDFGDDKLMIVEDNEEEAYQIIKEELGTEPVKLMTGSLSEMKFRSMEFDKFVRLAELSYSVNGENVLYYISASYTNSSLGMDIEDKIVEEYQVKRDDCTIEIKGYETQDTKANRYLASFKYRGLEYFLIGVMKREELDIILKNMYFI